LQCTDKCLLHGNISHLQIYHTNAAINSNLDVCLICRHISKCSVRGNIQHLQIYDAYAAVNSHLDVCSIWQCTGKSSVCGNILHLHAHGAYAAVKSNVHVCLMCRHIGNCLVCGNISSAWECSAFADQWRMCRGQLIFGCIAQFGGAQTSVWCVGIFRICTPMVHMPRSTDIWMCGIITQFIGQPFNAEIFSIYIATVISLLLCLTGCRKVMPKYVLNLLVHGKLCDAWEYSTFPLPRQVKLLPIVHWQYLPQQIRCV
jgi:hypothetical protein